MRRIICLLLCTVLLFVGCAPVDKLYYADQSNYIGVTGTVRYVQYDEEGAALYISLEECPEGFSDTTFKLTGDGLTIAQERGIDELLQLGGEITFTAAPRYFGDGYVIPVAAIEVEGVTLLGFDEGYAALMDWIKEQ